MLRLLLAMSIPLRLPISVLADTVELTCSEISVRRLQPEHRQLGLHTGERFAHEDATDRHN